MPARNLIIIIHQDLLDYRDFEEIGRLVVRRNSDIRFSLLSVDDDIANFPTIDWRLPTFTVSLGSETRSHPKRGTVFFNRQINKLRQIEIFERSGIKAPRSKMFSHKFDHSPNEWGDFVIIKSRELIGSSSGRVAHLTPTRFLSQPEKLPDPVKSLLISGQAIVQEYIPTGRTAESFRVGTFLGKMLYQMRNTSPVILPKLDPILPVTAICDSKNDGTEKGKDIERRLMKDSEIAEFGVKVAKAFPGIPLLGVDVLRHEITNELYALEVNAGGNTWHFSSPMRTASISREDRINQYGAWDIAASVLIEKTLYYAK